MEEPGTPGACSQVPLWERKGGAETSTPGTFFSEASPPSPGQRESKRWTEARNYMKVLSHGRRYKNYKHFKYKTTEPPVYEANLDKTDGRNRFYSAIVIVGDFSSSLSLMDRISRQKINK